MNNNLYSVNNVVFQNIIDALPVLLFWTDTKHLVLGSNLLHAKAFGYQSVDEIIGRSTKELLVERINLSEDFVEMIYREHEEIIRTGEARIIEYVATLSDRREGTYLSYKQPLLDENKNLIGLIGVSFDISELKRTQNELAKASQKIEAIKRAQSEFIANIISENKYVVTNRIFQDIIDALPVLLFWVDENDIYLGNNKLHAESFGYSDVGEIIGQSVPESLTNVGFSPDLIEKISVDHRNIMREKKGQVIEYTVTLSDGNEGIWLSHKHPLMDENGKVIGLVGISMDITELKNTQKQLAEEKKRAEVASQAKSEFIANMNHDLRTPLSGMSGMVQTLMQNTFAVAHDIDQGKALSLEEQKRLITNIQRDSEILMGSTNELLQLCNEVMETVSLESGEVKAKIESFDLRELLQHNLDMMRAPAFHRGLDLSMEVSDSVPQFLEGLRACLDRSLLNLIGNSLKFTEKGFVKVKVSLSDMLEPNNHTVMLQIVVEDSGIGIPEDKFETIFEHFSRLTPSHEGHYKGSGLGLYAVKQHVKALKGMVKVASEVGKGSTFTLILPFKISDHSDYQRTSIRPLEVQRLDKQPVSLFEEPEGEVVPEAGQGFVLVVEDNPAAAMSIMTTLRGFSCVAEWAKTGKEAVSKATSKAYDLIISDIGLPDFDGLTVAKKIRACGDARYSQVPIVALTGHLHKGTACQDAGMQAVMVKPAEPRKVLEVLNTYIFKENPIIPVEDKMLEQPKPSRVNESPATADLPVIDWEVSKKMTRNSEAMLLDILAICFNDLQITRERLKTGFAQNAIKAMREELHRSLGGICYIKLPDLDSRLKAFHEALKEEPQNPTKLQDTYDKALQSIQRFFDFYEKKIN